MEQLTFILKRLAMLIIMLIGVASIVFALTKMVPGDPVTANLSQRSLNDPVVVEAFKVKHGLDKSLMTQYLIHMKNIFQTGSRDFHAYQ